MQTNHKHYEAARRAHYWTSFSPDKRAESECNFFDEIIAEFEQLGVSEEGKAKFERLFLLSMSAKSRCASAMITGPAKFPVEKNRRANERERKISDELLAYIDRVRKAIDKQNNPGKYASDAVRSDDENAIDKLKEKLAKLQKAQEQMKACNAIIRDKKEKKVERLAEILGTKERAEALLIPDFCKRIGFASYTLTNNNTTIKATQKRIAILEKAATRKTRKLEIAGVKVVENAEESRIQFFFDGKPAREIIDLMKRHGFKWSPRRLCWQRLWNENAVFSVTHYIAPALKQIQGVA
jgi:hypothetical protein